MTHRIKIINKEIMSFSNKGMLTRITSDAIKSSKHVT